MAKVDTIQLSTNKFVNIGTQNIIGLVVANTHTSDIGFDLILGDKSLDNTTSTSGAIHVLKSIPIPTGSTFVWDDDNVLSGIFESGSTVSNFDFAINSFALVKGLTFLIRLDTDSHAASVILRRQ